MLISGPQHTQMDKKIKAREKRTFFFVIKVKRQGQLHIRTFEPTYLFEKLNTHVFFSCRLKQNCYATQTLSALGLVDSMAGELLSFLSSA